MIHQGAISLPRKRTEFREHARRRGSYHDVYKKETSNEVPELCIEADEKVGQIFHNSCFMLFGKVFNLTSCNLFLFEIDKHW